MFRILTSLLLMTAIAQGAWAQSESLPVDEATLEGHKVYNQVEHPATFPGGQKAWSAAIHKVLQQYTALLAQDGRQSRGECDLQFVVWYDGSVSCVRPTTMTNSILAQVLVDYIENQSRWEPAMQNGYVVNAYHRIKVTYPE
jgi:hypothetical protein